MLKKNLEVSVLMSVYNCENFVSEAIYSVLNQTYVNFELIIIDDGSTDKTKDIIKNFSDKRIRLIQNKENLGLPRSLNIGLKVAQGKYIARLDADDICSPDRLLLQLNYLKEHPNVGVLGTDVEFIDEVGNKFKSAKRLKKIKSHNPISYFFNLQKPKSHNVCVWYLLFRNCFYHPTVMFKKSIVINVGGYENKKSEDLDLWSRLFDKTNFTNLKIPLLSHRIHSGQMTSETRSKELDIRIEARKRVFSTIFTENTNLDFIRLLSLRSNKSGDQLKSSLIFLDQTYINFIKKYLLSPVEKWQIRIDYIRLSSIISNNFSIIKIIHSIIKLLIIEFKK